MSFDFATTQVNGEHRTLEVKHPASGETIAEIDLLSIDDDKPAAVKAAQDKRRLKSRNPLKLDMAELRSDTLDVLAACTVAWRGVEWNGEPMECTPGNARKLYDALPWLKAEVERFVSDVAVFLEK